MKRGEPQRPQVSTTVSLWDGQDHRRASHASCLTDQTMSRLPSQDGSSQTHDCQRCNLVETVAWNQKGLWVWLDVVNLVSGEGIDQVSAQAGLTLEAQLKV